MTIEAASPVRIATNGAGIGDVYAAPFVPQPQTLEETGLDFSTALDLVIKAIYFSGRPSARQICSQLQLQFSALEEVFAFLKREQLAEIVGSAGMGEQLYQYSLTQKGTEKADEALNRNQYIGPAPVSFEQYLRVLEQQSIRSVSITPESVAAAVAHLVLADEVTAALGPAVNSGRSMLLYGGSGNGKSTITGAIGRMLPGEVLIPYAIDLGGTIVKVFDPRVHTEIPIEQQRERRQSDPMAAVAQNGIERRRDRRWAVTRRPIISVGGELTLKDLELQYSAQSQFYVAPLQWKANGGILVVDDFGRQRIQPKELLNRWIVPMEERLDHLSLHTGDVIEVPFDLLLIFSTNLHPSQLGDEAFLRRIRHKVQIPDPTRDEFIEILTRVCQERELSLDPQAVLHLIDQYYVRAGRQYKGCHPRDIIDLIVDFANYRGERPAVTQEGVDAACHSYFVDGTDDDVQLHARQFGGLEANAA